MVEPTKFPISTWQRILNRQGPRTVSCIVSERYLSFAQPTGAGEFGPMKIGTAVEVDVMTKATEGSVGRKICSLIVTIEQLKQMVETLERERDRKT